jgi:ribosomal protein S18 acetylase RimI-like enzyme
VPHDLQLQPFGQEHVDLFLKHGTAEGWLTDHREIDFLTRCFPRGCLVGLLDGEPAGFITSLRYSTSAWIGNLLVLPHCRRKGIGRTLMEAVLLQLDRNGCATVWLTASSAGAGLYRGLGFVPMDTIHRWQVAGSLPATMPCAVDLEQAAFIDRMGWGDSRAVLFSGRQDCGGWLLRQDGFLRCMQAGSGRQIGPWGALNGNCAGKLLESLMAGVSGTGTMFLDVPGNNRNAGRLLQRQGFAESGSTLLMYRGAAPGYRPELVYSLASMGSYG